MKCCWHRVVAIVGCLVVIFTFSACSAAENRDLKSAVTTPKSSVTVAADWTSNAEGALIAEPEEGYTYVGETKQWALFYNYSTGAFYVCNPQGSVWRSNPLGIDLDTSIANSVRLKYDSQLLLRYADKSSNIYEVASKTYSVRQDGFSAEPIHGGVRATYVFPKYGFSIPVEILMTDDGLCARVLSQDIVQSDERYRLTGFSLLPYFGAGSRTDEGYMVVPDGSGAIIEFNNGKQRFGEYAQYVYGRDSAVEVSAKKTNTTQAMLPIFGIRNQGKAMLAVISSGASRSLIKANVTANNNAFNSVYCEFLYLDNAFASFNDKTWKKKEVRIFEKQSAPLEEYAITYLLLGDNESTYVDMANRYQEYLIDHDELKTTKENNYPFLLNVVGSIKTQQHILGFPVKQEVGLTTFKDTQMILEKLIAGGVSNVTLKYDSWIQGGPESSAPVNPTPSKALGGKSDLKTLLAYMQKNNVAGFFDINLTDVYSSRMGYSVRNDSALMLNQSPVIQKAFLRSTHLQDTQIPTWYLLKPSRVYSLAGAASKEIVKTGIPGISLDTLSTKLYSSYNEEGEDRVSAENFWKSSIQTFVDKELAFMGESPNAYVLPYVDFVSSLPVKSSEYLIEDYSIPFYQIVLHGYVPYTTTPINQTSSAQISLLRALETGSCLQYTWIADSSVNLNDSIYDELYNANYSDWLDNAVDSYQEIQGFMSSVANQTIVGHVILQEGVTKTVYESGKSVIVNYNPLPVDIGGIHIGAESYYVFN